MARFTNFLYNIDRAIASLGGARPQETISAAVGRISRGEADAHYRWETWVARRLVSWLNGHPRIWGASHTEKAIHHADELNKCDTGEEQ